MWKPDICFLLVFHCTVVHWLLIFSRVHGVIFMQSEEPVIRAIKSWYDCAVTSKNSPKKYMLDQTWKFFFTKVMYTYSNDKGKKGCFTNMLRSTTGFLSIASLAKRKLQTQFGRSKDRHWSSLPWNASTSSFSLPWNHCPMHINIRYYSSQWPLTWTIISRLISRKHWKITPNTHSYQVFL